jgi:hypothetical protein
MGHRRGGCGAEKLAKLSDDAVARAADLISRNRDLLVGSRNVVAQSQFYLKGTNRLPARHSEQERTHLNLADTHIKDARERIQRQRHLIGHLAKRGQPTDTAEQILQTMLRTLQAMEGHRDIILARLNAR